jgi:ATP-dependent helicase/DNAse subunit B
MAMIRVKNQLLLSYPVIDFDGKSIRSSMLIHMVTQLFPNNKIERLEQLTNKHIIINRHQPTFERMMAGINESRISEDKKRQIQGLLHWYEKHGGYYELYQELMDHKLKVRMEKHF